MSALYTTNEVLIAGVLFLSLLATAELGFLLGHRACSRISDKTKAEISVIQASMLGILGLLLAFTISMAVSRFELRKQLIVDEANAIGTSCLRTDLIPEPDRGYIANRLRDYLGLRLRAAHAGDDVSTPTNANAVKSMREETQRVEIDFWGRAVACAQKDPNPVTTGLLLQSLNELIDMDTARWAAFNNHVPETVVYVNAIVALLATILVGYSIGLAGRRNLFSVILLCTAITITLIVIIDLDRPRQGLITVTQEPLMDLEEQLSSH